MRELRQDVEYKLEPPKEELDQIDEMKIEEVLMGLKGLKQEEVFSFLGKNNFTPAETEMTTAGLGNYEQLSAVDTTDMEQLQLSFNAHFEGAQGNHGHPIIPNSYMSKLTNVERFKSKIDSEAAYDETLSGDTTSQYGWTSQKRSKDEDAQPLQRFPSIWPRYPGTTNYPLLDYHTESLREEEIVATNIAEELICTTSDDRVDLKTAQPSNNYIIHSSVDNIDTVPDKPKPIKLLIKRVESEDEVSDSPASRVKLKRTRQPSAKRRQEEMSISPKRKRVKRPSLSKCKKSQNNPTNTTPEQETPYDIDFPLVNSVHQDDDFVYPLLDMSDDEDDVYSFSQRDDETWIPKIKMKIDDAKNDRPARDRKKNNVVAKYLEAVAMKRVKASDSTKSKKKGSTTSLEKRKCTASSIVPEEKRSSYHNTSTPGVNQSAGSFTLPSTSNNDPCYSLSSSFTESSSGSEIAEINSSGPRKLGIKSKNKFIKQKARRIIPPKTCKLVQEPPGAKPTTLTVQMNSAKKLKSAASISSTAGSNSPAGDKKSPSTAYVTKRGKPKKGMATAKQRLGKILKMHKMFL